MIALLIYIAGMKTMQMSVAGKVLAAGTVLFAAARIAAAGEPTAFDLAKEGNRYVGEQSKDKVVQIRSDKSVGTLTPAVWYVVYYDPDATLKAVEVKFGAGKKLDVSHPVRLLEPVTGGDKVLDRAKLKVDSDDALKTATSETTNRPRLSRTAARTISSQLVLMSCSTYW